MQRAIELRPGGRVPDSGTITVNLGRIELGPVDRLVSEGACAERCDIVRPAIRALLAGRLR